MDVTPSWDTLVRLWLATGLRDEELYARALITLRDHHGEADEPIRFVLSQLKDDPLKRFSPDLKFEFKLDQREVLTLRCCLLFPGAMTADIVPHASPADRPELGRVVLRTCAQLDEIAEQLQDLPLRAAVCRLACSGGRHSSPASAAHGFGRNAVRLYRQLSRQSESWLPYLGESLVSIALTIQTGGKIGSAVRCLNSASRIYQILESRQMGIYAEEHALIDHNLSNLHVARDRWEEALERSTAASSRYRELAEQHPDRYLPALVASLGRLALSLQSLKRHDAALEIAKAAARVARALAIESPDTYRSLHADSLLRIASCLRDAGRFREARLMAWRAVTVDPPAGDSSDTALQAWTASAFDLHAECCVLTRQFDAAVGSYEKSQYHYKTAVTDSPTKHLGDLAESHNRLSVVLSEIGRPEDALHHARLAIDFLKRLTESSTVPNSQDLALMANNLAARYFKLGDVDSALSFSWQATRLLRRSGADRSPAMAAHFASVLLNFSTFLATAGYLKRSVPPLDKAAALIAACRSGLSPASNKHAPLHAKILANRSLRLLENGHIDLAITSGAEAVDLYRALIEKGETGYLSSLAFALNNFALGLFASGRDHEAESAIDQALDVLDSPVCQRPALLEDAVLIRRNKALRLMKRSDPSLLEPAGAVLRQALACCDQWRRSYRGSMHRRRVQERARELADWQMGICLGLSALGQGQPPLREALEVSEMARARLLNDMLSESERVPTGCDSELVRRYFRIRRELAELEEHVVTPPGLCEATAGLPKPTGLRLSAEELVAIPCRDIDVGTKISESRLRLSEALASIHRYDPRWDPDVVVEVASLDRIAAALPEASAMLHFSILRDRLVALVLWPNGTIRSVEIPGLTGGALRRLGQLWSSACNGLRRQRLDFPQFSRIIRAHLETVSAIFEGEMGELLSDLKGHVRDLVICPSGALHLLPLHACALPDGRLLGDVFGISYIPSASTLALVSHRRSPNNHRPCLIANPTGDLGFSDLEQAVLTARHGYSVSLAGEDASKKNSIAAIANASEFVFSGHARFSEHDPTASGLTLADGVLTINNLMAGDLLKGCRMAFLNGCESGFLRPDSTDDFVSLPNACLFAGANSVVATLWPIHDLPAALFSIRFHELWKLEGLPVLRAFDKAKRWLRGDDPDGLVNHERLVEVIESCLHLTTHTASNAMNEALRSFTGDHPPFAEVSYWASFILHGSMTELGSK